MKNENELNSIISKNLTEYRKVNGLTQLELANKLNYSDKAISKWERGESLPGIYILYTLAELYGVTVNDFMVTDKTIEKKPRNMFKKRIITTLSAGIVWLAAVVAWAIISMVTGSTENTWLTFIVALPITAIVVVVFACLWESKLHQLLSISILIWTSALCLFILLNTLLDNYRYAWLFFIMAIPVQMLTIIWYIYQFNRNNKEQN